MIALWLALSAWAAGPTGPSCAGPVGHGFDDWRPPLSGEAQVLDTPDGDFRLHWTDAGVDDAGGDGDGDGVPDVVEIVRDAVVGARARFEEVGWRPLVDDDGLGGSPALDVYIVDIDANGYANAADPAEGEDGAACYLRVDPGVIGLGEGVLASVAVHELHHCVQYRYATGLSTWLYEGQATLEQFRQDRDAGMDLALAVLWAQRLSSPGRALAATGNRFEYAAFTFFKFWEERGRVDAARLPDLWTALENGDDGLWQAALDTFDQDLDAVVLDHRVWNAFACARDDGQHYGDQVAPCTADAATVPLEVGPATGRLQVDLPAGLYSAAYVELPPAQVPGEVLTLRCALPAGVSAAVTAVPALPVVSGVTRVDLDEQPVVLAFSNAEPDPATLTCDLFREVLEEPGCAGCSASRGPGSAWWVLLGVGLVRRRRI